MLLFQPDQPFFLLIIIEHLVGQNWEQIYKWLSQSFEIQLIWSQVHIFLKRNNFV